MGPRLVNPALTGVKQKFSMNGPTRRPVKGDKFQAPNPLPTHGFFGSNTVSKLSPVTSKMFPDDESMAMEHDECSITIRSNHYLWPLGVMPLPHPLYALGCRDGWM